MKTTKSSRNHLMTLAILGLAVAAGVSGCSSGPYISKNIKNPVKLTPSPTHGFESITIEQQRGRLTVYGRLEHRHTFCLTEGHVDLALTSAQGGTTFQASVPIVYRGYKRRGWYSASFRARLPLRVAPNTIVRVAVHDPSCFKGDTFNCGANRAHVGGSNRK